MTYMVKTLWHNIAVQEFYRQPMQIACHTVSTYALKNAAKFLQD